MGNQTISKERLKSFLRKLEINLEVAQETLAEPTTLDFLTQRREAKVHAAENVLKMYKEHFPELEEK